MAKFGRSIADAGVALCTLSVLIILGAIALEVSKAPSVIIGRVIPVVGQVLGGELMVFCLPCAIVGLILIAVGRVLAGAGKK
jgi:hypothetical protein